MGRTLAHVQGDANRFFSSPEGSKRAEKEKENRKTPKDERTVSEDSGQGEMCVGVVERQFLMNRRKTIQTIAIEVQPVLPPRAERF